MGIYWGCAGLASQKKTQKSIEYQLDYLKNEADNLGYEFRPVVEDESEDLSEKLDPLLELAEAAAEGDYVGFYDDSILKKNMVEMAELVDKLLKKGVFVQVDGKNINKNVTEPRIIFIIVFFIGVAGWLCYLFFR